MLVVQARLAGARTLPTAATRLRRRAVMPPCSLRAPARRCLLARMRQRRLAHPGAVVPGLDARRQPLAVARPMAADDAPELVPVDGAEVVRAARLVPLQRPGRAASRPAPWPARRMASTNFCRSSSLDMRLMPQRIDCALFGLSASGGPNIIRLGHHQRFTASCTIARWAVGALRHHHQQRVEALALVEALLAADAHHRPRIGRVASSASAAPGS